MSTAQAQGATTQASGNTAQVPTAEQQKVAVLAINDIVDTAVNVALSAALPKLEARLADLEAALVSHVAVTVAGGPSGNHFMGFYKRFKHLIGVTDAIVNPEVTK
jgi:hypothetical protein